MVPSSARSRPNLSGRQPTPGRIPTGRSALSSRRADSSRSLKPETNVYGNENALTDNIGMGSARRPGTGGPTSSRSRGAMFSAPAESHVDPEEFLARMRATKAAESKAKAKVREE